MRQWSVSKPSDGHHQERVWSILDLVPSLSPHTDAIIEWINFYIYFWPPTGFSDLRFPRPMADSSATGCATAVAVVVGDLVRRIECHLDCGSSRTKVEFHKGRTVKAFIESRQTLTTTQTSASHRRKSKVVARVVNFSPIVSASSCRTENFVIKVPTRSSVSILHWSVLLLVYLSGG